MINDLSQQETDFLIQSNWIEREYSDTAHEDAMSAWRLAITSDVLFVKDFLEIHRVLMTRLRPDIAGQYRKCDVYIGGKRKKYRGVELLESLLTDVANFMIESFKLETTAEKEKACIDAHVMFETAHPFEDGNGRAGRIIYNWHRLKLGLPIHVIHVGVEQLEYYSLFAIDEKQTN